MFKTNVNIKKTKSESLEISYWQSEYENEPGTDKKYSETVKLYSLDLFATISLFYSLLRKVWTTEQISQIWNGRMKNEDS